MSGFSSEIARIVSGFIEGQRDDPPTIYRLVEQICEENELLLVKVKIYENGKIFRANLYFTGKKDMIFRNFRASDAISTGDLLQHPNTCKKIYVERHRKKYT